MTGKMAKRTHKDAQIPKRLVLIAFDDHEDVSYCTHDVESSQLVKLSRDESAALDTLKDPRDALSLFLRTQLPFITFHDVNVFDFYDDKLPRFDLRYYTYADAILERDVEIPNDLGMKRRAHSSMESPLEHHYLPGMPNLIYEDYPFFHPHVLQSEELSNDAFYKMHVKPFEKLLEKKVRKKTTKELKAFTDYIKNLDLYQTPVDHAEYFTFSVYDFKDIFVDKLLGYIVDIYAAFFFKDKDALREYFQEYDEEYTPELRKDCYTSLKPVGTCAESPYAWGIYDKETLLLNKLWVHVEFVNMCSGIAEGYELVFGSKKRNFEKQRIIGSEFTKKSNFLKRFTKCVSICLNSGTKRFVMTDYYWVACFEIEDVFDGEIEDAKRFISKVKVRHFSYSNFETGDDRLTIRSIIASFFFTTPEQCETDLKQLEAINKRVIKEWTTFQKSDSPLHPTTQQQHKRKKRMKLSPFIYRTPTGLSFTKQSVDLEKSLLRFIAIGTTWSCQTLLVDIKKLYKDRPYLSQLEYEGPKEVLLSIYDEYYQDPSLSMVSRHHKNINAKFGSTQLITNAEEVLNNWLLNVEAYIRLKPLQGEVLAKMVDYGFLEDKKYNAAEPHFKCDGYYILYEPICSNQDDLEPIDTNNTKHHELAKEVLKKIHEHGVTFAPNSSITKDILKVYNGKIFVINLEGVTSTGVTPSHIKRDFAQLNRIFSKGAAAMKKKPVELTAEQLMYLDEFDESDEFSDSASDEELY